MSSRTPVGEQFAGVLEAARAGADWAWQILYDSLAPSLLGYLRSRGAPDPDGVCGEVFAQLVRDIGRFEGDETGFRSWVFVMAHHRLLDDLRRRSRRPETPTAPETMVDIEDRSDVEAEVLDRRRADELKTVLDNLTPSQREVLLLRIWGGLTVEEVAEAVGRRPGAVKALQRRGLEAVRKMLGDASDRGVPS